MSDYLSLSLVQNLEDAEKIAQHFAQIVAKEPEIDAINIYYHSHTSPQRIFKNNELQLFLP